MKIISIKTHPEYERKIINYFKKVWSTEASEKVYEDSITHSKNEGLPNWYLLLNEEEVIGCVGLITNDLSVAWIYIHGLLHCILSLIIEDIIIVIY